MKRYPRGSSPERQWERLLEFLNGFGAARETGPGRIEVALDGRGISPRTVEILITKHQWNNMVTMPWGVDFDGAAEEVRRVLSGLRSHETYLVYSEYGLVPSASVTLPVE